MTEEGAGGAAGPPEGAGSPDLAQAAVSPPVPLGPWRCPMPTSAAPTAAAPASSRPRGRGGPSSLSLTPGTLPGGHWLTAVSDAPGDMGGRGRGPGGAGGLRGAAGLQARGPPLSGPVSKAWGGVREHSAAPPPVHTSCGPQLPHGALFPPRGAFLEQAALFHQLQPSALPLNRFS